MPAANSRNNNLSFKLDEAIKLKQEGRLQQAATLLKNLATLHPKSAAVAGYLGGVYFEMGAFQDAEKSFCRATTLNPRSELASLGLFHTLWQLERKGNAFSEMRRFLTISDSDQYKSLLRDLAVEGHLDRQLEAVGSAR